MDLKKTGRRVVERETVEIKAFVPAKDFDLSKTFYEELGFETAWSSGDLAYLRRGHTSFLLQNVYIQAHAENTVMHLLVTDVEDWWRHVQAVDLPGRYDVYAEAPEDRPWGMRDFVLMDPSGVLWRIAQNTTPPRGTA